MSLTSLLPLAPELTLLIGACVCLIAGASGSAARAALISPIALVTILGALALSMTGGNEPAIPIPGILLSSLSTYTRYVTLSVGLLIVLVNFHQSRHAERGEYLAMILFSLLGVLLTSSANDLVMLFFAVELVSIPAYVLIALSRDDARASEAVVKYFFLGALAAAILAYGLSFLYGVTGTTTLQSVSDGNVASLWPHATELTDLGLIGLLLVIGGLAFKIAAVPFHVYAPDVYEGAASPITAMLGFVPKFAGFLALTRIFAALHWDFPESIHWILWTLAALTMTVGNVLALLQNSVKRMLAYSSIAHTGYMLVALLIGPVSSTGPMRDGIVALLFYITVYGVMNLGAFALLACIDRNGDEAESLEDIAGLSRRRPFAALALAICVFSLMGFPPTAGFLGKFYVFSSALSLDANHPFHGPVIALVIIGVVNSAIAAAYYLKIVAAVYVRPSVGESRTAGGLPLRLALAVCAVTMLALFIWPKGMVEQARSATVVLHQSIQNTSEKVTGQTGSNTELASAE